LIEVARLRNREAIGAQIGEFFNHFVAHLKLGERPYLGLYKNETPNGMLKAIEQLRSTIETGVDRNSVQGLLPAGGAHNALDCALWDLEAKLTHRAA
jgi:hypothetical protein